METIKEGETAPDFTLNDADGKEHRLSDYLGKRVVLYFYPKDDTPGCTKEACTFRDDYSIFIEKGAAILGISPDDVKSHKKFSEKYSLPFPLLADIDKTVVKSYDVWKSKKFMGKESLGIVRTTFVIDEQGKILKVFPNVNVDGHSKEILELLG